MDSTPQMSGPARDSRGKADEGVGRGPGGPPTTYCKNHGDRRLAEAGVEWDARRGVKVNEYLQSISNPAVYAAGDAAASEGPKLTPVASHEGQIVADNILKGNHRKPNYEGTPSVVFTVPPLASVGLQERTARELGLAFRVNQQDTSS